MNAADFHFWVDVILVYSGVFVGSLGFAVLWANACRATWCLSVMLLPGRELWLGFYSSTIINSRPRHDEIVSSLRIELSPFIRIIFRADINTAAQQYEGTK